jgi:hypothetical protein
MEQRMSTQRFDAVIEKSGTKHFIVLPFDPNNVWGDKQRHDITGTVNGCDIRGPLGLEEGAYVLSLGPAWRRDHQLEAGAAVAVVLDSEGPQVDALAPDLSEALSAHAQARTFFESLPTFYRKNYIRWVEGAKRPETRSARIAEMIKLLDAGKREK